MATPSACCQGRDQQGSLLFSWRSPFSLKLDGCWAGLPEAWAKPLSSRPPIFWEVRFWGSQQASSPMKEMSSNIAAGMQGQPSPGAQSYARPRHRARGCQVLARIHPAHTLPALKSFFQNKTITSAFASSVLLGSTTPVCCLLWCSALLPGGCRWAMPAGSCGMRRRIRACQHQHCLPTKPHA